MAQYIEGTVDVVNGSSTIIGVGTQWLTDPIQPIAVNDLFGVKVVGEDVLYEVAAVVSDAEITISSPFGGTTANGLNYAISRDFTPGGLPLMNTEDAFLPQLFNRAIADLESAVNTTPFTLPVADTAPLVKDDIDDTKLVRIDTGDVPGATTRAILMPNSDVDFRAPAQLVRRVMQEPIIGNSLTGIANVFDGDPASADCMLGELLQCDNSGGNFNLQFNPALIISPAGWNGLLCWIRPTSNANLFSISVPAAGDFSWNNGYPNPDQNVTVLYFGLSQNFVVGNVLPVFLRGTKIVVWGPVRSDPNEDLVYRFGTADADAQGGVVRNFANGNESQGDGYAFTTLDAGGVRLFGGGAPATWTVPNLTLPAQGSLAVTVHNVGTATLTFLNSGVTFVQAETDLPPGGSAVVEWLGDPLSPGTFLVKITGQLS